MSHPNRTAYETCEECGERVALRGSIVQHLPKVGDVVSLAGGGTPMTVTFVSEKPEGTSVMVSWFDTDCRVQSSTWPLEVLVRLWGPRVGGTCEE